MAFDSVIISSGHGKYVRGAAGIIDEVDEARRVVDSVYEELRTRGFEVKKFHDDTSHSQNENLETIVEYHNHYLRDLDISVHFNAFEQVSKPMGTEVFYVTQKDLAGKMSNAISLDGGFIDRGPKKSSDLYFLNHTEMPAILIEVCFVDSETDCMFYEKNFKDICMAIVDVIAGEEDDIIIPPPQVEAPVGKVSWFGGPDDDGVDPNEGLAFISDIDQAEHLFLPNQPEGTSGLARRLNPHVHYFAMRFDYDEIPKSELLNHIGLIRNIKTGFALEAFPADWGPHEDTGRLVDVSPGLMWDLALATDDEVEVIFPYKETQI